MRSRIMAAVLLVLLLNAASCSREDVTISIKLFDPANIRSQIPYLGGRVRIICTYSDEIKANKSLKRISSNPPLEVAKGGPNDAQLSHEFAITKSVHRSEWQCFTDDGRKSHEKYSMNYILCNPSMMTMKACKEKDTFCTYSSIKPQGNCDIFPQSLCQSNERFTTPCPRYGLLNTCNLLFIGTLKGTDYTALEGSRCENKLKLGLLVRGDAFELLQLYGWTYVDASFQYAIWVHASAPAKLTLRCNAASNNGIKSRDEFSVQANTTWLPKNLNTTIGNLSQPSTIYIACSGDDTKTNTTQLIFSTQLFVFKSDRDLDYHLTSLSHTSTAYNIQVKIRLKATAAKGLDVCVVYLVTNKTRCSRDRSKPEVLLDITVPCERGEGKCGAKFGIGLGVSSPTEQDVAIYSKIVALSVDKRATAPTTTTTTTTTTKAIRRKGRLRRYQCIMGFCQTCRIGVVGSCRYDGNLYYSIEECNANCPSRYFCSRWYTCMSCGGLKHLRCPRWIYMELGECRATCETHQRRRSAANPRPVPAVVVIAALVIIATIAAGGTDIPGQYLIETAETEYNNQSGELAAEASEVRKNATCDTELLIKATAGTPELKPAFYKAVPKKTMGFC